MPDNKSVKKPISQIKPNPNNPRIIKDDKFKKLVDSLKDFPEMAEVRPVVVNKDMVILGGNMRFKAAKEAGWKEIPVTIVDWSEEKQRQFIIKDNVSGGEWDWDTLANEWDAEELDKWGLDTPDGWNEDAEIEEDEAPEVSDEEPVSKLGEIYQLGRHRVMCGDSTDKANVELLMNGVRADMVFTDPPYGVEYTGGHNKKKRTGIENDELQGQDLTDLFHDSLNNAIEISNDHSAFYIWYASGKSVDTFASFAELGLELRAVIQWYKVNSGLGAFMSQYIPNCEPCMYAFKTGHSPQWFGASDEKTVWELKRQGKSEYHPTQKPIELCARAIKNSSKTGQIIYDAFLGSGSTLIACEQTDRTCYGMELDPKYVDVIRKRYAKFISPDNQLPENWEELTQRI